MNILTLFVFLFTGVITTLTSTNSHAGRIINKNNPEDVVEIVKSQEMVQLRATWGAYLKEKQTDVYSLSNDIASNKRSFKKGIVIVPDGNGWLYSRRYVLGLDRPYSITAQNVKDVSYEDFGLDHIVFIPVVAGLETIILPISGTAAVIKNISTNRDVQMIMKAMEEDRDIQVSEKRFIRALHYLDLIPFKWD